MKRAAMILLVGLTSICMAQLPSAGPVATQATPSTLSPETLQAAEYIGVKPLLEQLQQLQSHHEATGTGNFQELLVRQEIYDEVLAASLDVDSVAAEIDSERSRLSGISNRIEDDQQKAVHTSTLASIIVGTGGVLGTGLQLSKSRGTQNVGNSIGVAAGSASTALQLYSLHEQSGGTAAVGRVPNMLAPLFGKPSKLHTGYPPVIWKFLNSAPEGMSTTRLQQLKMEWANAGRISLSSAPATQKRIDLLTASMNPGQKLDVQTLNDRTAMLADVRARIMLMKRDLADLLRSLRRQP